MQNRTKQGQAPLAEAMRAYRLDGALAFHTPGHKQGIGAHPLLKELLTEEGLKEEVSLMEELDDLHAPATCIREAQDLSAELYGAEAAYFCINGTTGAVQAMLLAALQADDTVLVPRNAHRSIVGGLVLSGARPVYLRPEQDARLGIPMGVSLETIKAACLEHPEAGALVLVYPTYYGVTVDLVAIADFVHARGMLLLVDEAHGAHLPFSEALPAEAIAAGADLAALSTHKLLGSLTQTSMLLLGAGGRIDQERLRESLSLLQSTSPNQLLLASLDIARLQMEEHGQALVGKAVSLAEGLRKRINSIPGLWSPSLAEIASAGAQGLDLTKVTVQVSGLGLSGPEAEHYLRHEQKIQCELSDARNLLFIISYADTEAEAERLAVALEALSAWAQRQQKFEKEALIPMMEGALPEAGEQVLKPREAFFAVKEQVPFAQAAGRISGEQVMFYPPGVPLLVPGERIAHNLLDYIRRQQWLGLKVAGPADLSLEYLKVVKE